MPGSNILHTMEILNAVAPCLDPRSKTTMDLLIKLSEFLNCYQIFRTSRLSACNYEKQDFDMESVLNKIRPVCSEKERANVDKILGIYKAKKIMEMYNTYMSVMNSMQGTSGTQSNSTDNTGFTDNILKNFSGFDFSSLFNGTASDAKPDTEPDNSKHDEHTGMHYNPETSESFTGQNNSEAYGNAANHYNSEYHYDNNNSHPDSATQAEENLNPGNDAGSDKINSSDAGSGTATGNKSQEDMFNTLKTMIPPEQMSTFENLRMLFSAMSYDSSKSDHN